jgi:hypothetical protein
LFNGDVASPLKNMVRGWLAHLIVVTPPRRSRLGK